MKLFRILTLLAAATLLVGAVVACDDDDDEEDNGGGPAATTEAAADETPEETDAADDTGAATGGADDEVQVAMLDFSYDPASFTVPAGVPVKVEARNEGASPHTLTVYTDQEYNDAVDDADTGTISGGEDGEFTATFEGGEYYFRCEVHPTQMTGTFEAE
jgi:plastocyanin